MIYYGFGVGGGERGCTLIFLPTISPYTLVIGVRGEPINLIRGIGQDSNPWRSLRHRICTDALTDWTTSSWGCFKSILSSFQHQSSKVDIAGSLFEKVPIRFVSRARDLVRSSVDKPTRLWALWTLSFAAGARSKSEVHTISSSSIYICPFTKTDSHTSSLSFSHSDITVWPLTNKI